jgi:hypothetical protein
MAISRPMISTKHSPPAYSYKKLEVSDLQEFISDKSTNGSSDQFWRWIWGAETEEEMD